MALMVLEGAINTVYGGVWELLTLTQDMWREYFKDLLNSTSTYSEEKAESLESEMGPPISGAEVIEVFMSIMQEELTHTQFFRKNQGDFFVGCLFLTELSTPFVSLGKILIQLSLQDCWLHKFNGGMVLLTFFMCRIVLFPYMYWMYGRHYGISLYSVPFHLPFSTNLGSSCILAPQIYWFVLLCRKGHRLYQRSRQPHACPVTHSSKKD